MLRRKLDCGDRQVRIEGARATLEAIRAGRRRVRSVLLDGDSGVTRELEALARERRIPVRRDRLRGLTAAAEADPFPEEPFEDLLVEDRARFLVALDRVSDVGNLGSIARSAECAGVTGLVLEYRRSPPVEPGALRASAGALEHLRVGRTPSLRRALELAATEGIPILAAHPGGAPLSELPDPVLAGELVLVLGGEERGLRPSIREAADWVVGIPQWGRIESLGVAAAAAYLLLRVAEVRGAALLAGEPRIP
jgi:23S rRNA (guanosine2251-2'-O)-methyltransferase